ncbi:MAG: mechanosensitive ion channel domain-containing protein [Verrucomicrobiota bacterium]|jgi:small conductance mechanosensitive channel
MTNQLPELLTNTVINRLYGHVFGHNSSVGMRLLIIVGLAVLAHLLVKLIRHFSEWLIYKAHEETTPLGFVTQQPKFITVTRLIVSGVTFTIYFFAVGLLLQELLDINLTAYLASASIIALAISFGSQGLVQDIVSSLTLIFCNAMDVGDLVEIAGATNVSGQVEEIGLRYTTLVNFYHQRVLIPNRTIANVSRFPAGGVDAYGDVHLTSGIEQAAAAKIVEAIAKGMRAQFGAIIFSEPTVEKTALETGNLGTFLRVHFKIWPGQSSLIETTFRQRVISAMKALDPNYADWQVPVTYRATPLQQS